MTITTVHHTTNSHVTMRSSNGTSPCMQCYLWLISVVYRYVLLTVASPACLATKLLIELPCTIATKSKAVEEHEDRGTEFQN